MESPTMNRDTGVKNAIRVKNIAARSGGVGSSHGNGEDISTLPERLEAIINTLRTEYLRRHRDPWVLAYSGGKDSTLLLQLTWEMLESLPSRERKRELHIVSNDTLVESPLVIEHLKASMETIKKAANGLPIQTQITKPCIDQTFWVNVIGRGYIPPTRNFRWCTDRMKIAPTDQLLENLVRGHKRVVLLVGTRKSESANRRRNMEKHGVTGTRMNPHSSIQGCRMFAPLAELTDEDVWMVLMQRRPPWGGSHRHLITLYRNAGGGECPLVLTKEDAPSCGTTSPRFGCWTCTVVQKDRSMKGLIDSGEEDTEFLSSLFDFREWLIDLRENNENRKNIRRDGNARYRMDGSTVMGPFKLEIRKKILRRLRKLQKDTSQTLISKAEEEIIKDIWRRDQVREEAHQALRHAFALEETRGGVF